MLNFNKIVSGGCYSDPGRSCNWTGKLGVFFLKSGLGNLLVSIDFYTREAYLV